MHVCPNCGYCPNCGRRNVMPPHYPWGQYIPPQIPWQSPTAVPWTSPRITYSVSPQNFS